MPVVVKVSELLPWEEIEARYSPDWVFLMDVESDEHNRVVRGRVVAHAATHGELFEQAMPHASGGRYAVWCLADYPEDLLMMT